MRLDFSNIGRGLSAIADAKKARDLARESARYDVTEGAYGEGLQQNIEQVRGLMTEAQRQAAAQGGTVEDMSRIESEYMPSIRELQRRSQMTTPDFSIASGPQAFGTREEATRAARPMRAEGLANVYRQFGDVDRADELESRAQAQELTGLQVGRARRLDAEERGMLDAQRLLVGAEQAGQPVTSDFLRVVADQTGANFSQLVDTAAKSLGFTEASATARINQFKRDLSTAANKGVTGLNEFLAANFDPDQSDNIKPEVTKDANGNFVVTYDGRVLPQYGTNRSLNELIARAQANIDGDPIGAVKSIMQLDLLKAQTGLASSQAEALRNRPPGGRAPTQAEVTARARLYLDNDTTGELTAAGAIALAERDLGGGGGAAPEPTGIDRLVQLMEERREQERANQPGGLR